MLPSRGKWLVRIDRRGRRASKSARPERWGTDGGRFVGFKLAAQALAVASNDDSRNGFLDSTARLGWRGR